MRWARGFFGAFDATFLFGCWMWEAETGKGACCMLMNLAFFGVRSLTPRFANTEGSTLNTGSGQMPVSSVLSDATSQEVHDRDAVLLVRCAAVRKGDVLECDIVTL